MGGAAPSSTRLVLTRRAPRTSAPPRSPRGKLDVAEIDSDRGGTYLLGRARTPGKGKAGPPRRRAPGPRPRSAAATTPARRARGPGPRRTARTTRQGGGGEQGAREAAPRPRGSTPASSGRCAATWSASPSEPAYTQLALNGERGPLADERVRRAVARALDRQELADVVLKPLGLPAEAARQPSRARRAAGVRGQQRRARRPGHRKRRRRCWPTPAGRVGRARTEAGRDEGRQRGRGEEDRRRARRTPKAEEKSGTEEDAAEKDEADEKRRPRRPTEEGRREEGRRGLRHEGGRRRGGRRPEATSGVRQAGQGRHRRPVLRERRSAAQAEAVAGPAAGRRRHAGPELKQDTRQAGGDGGPTPRPARRPRRPEKRGPLGKDGKPLTLRFVLPSGPGSESLRTVGERIAADARPDRDPDRRSPRSPTTATSRTTSPRATTTWRCTPGPRPPTRRPTPGRSSPSPSPPPTAR